MAKEKTDQQVFKEFNLLGRDKKTLRDLVSSQRRINGRLYKSIEAILDALPKAPKKRKPGAKRKKGPGMVGFTLDLGKLTTAGKLNDEVPGDGVGCKSPPPPPGGGG
jgi:hypothetical protein